MITRIIAAIVLIPLVVVLIGEGSPRTLDLATAVITLLSAWEWSNLLRLRTVFYRALFIFIFLVAAFIIASLHHSVILYLSVGWWMVATVFVWLYPRGAKFFDDPLVLTFTSLIVLLPWWFAVHDLRQSGIGISAIFFVLALVWAADTSAYFVGKAWGKKKLAPALSPGKTVVGLIAGVGVPTLLTGLSSIWLGWVASHLFSMIALAFFVSGISTVGDLFISLLKRNRGIKDSGHVIPGHGGILDRIDSLTAAVPIFFLGLQWIGLH